MMVTANNVHGADAFGLCVFLCGLLELSEWTEKKFAARAYTKKRMALNKYHAG
jgi:hypothetical protein